MALSAGAVSAARSARGPCRDQRRHAVADWLAPPHLLPRTSLHLITASAASKVARRPDQYVRCVAGWQPPPLLVPCRPVPQSWMPDYRQSRRVMGRLAPPRSAGFVHRVAVVVSDLRPWPRAIVRREMGVNASFCEVFPQEQNRYHAVTRWILPEVLSCMEWYLSVKKSV